MKPLFIATNTFYAVYSPLGIEWYAERSFDRQFSSQVCKVLTSQIYVPLDRRIEWRIGAQLVSFISGGQIDATS